MHLHVGLLEVLVIASVVILVQFFERYGAIALGPDNAISKALGALAG